MENGSTGDLHFSVHLWMYDRGILVNDLQALAKVIKECVIELLVITGDDHPRHIELIDDGLPSKIVSFSFSDPG